jgi:hypothetical protein
VPLDNSYPERHREPFEENSPRRVTRLHLRFESARNVLNLRIAHLKAVRDFQPCDIQTEFICGPRQQVGMNREDQRRVRTVRFPNAGRIRRNHVDIAMYGPSAMLQSGPLATHVHGFPQMDRNSGARDAGSLHAARRIGCNTNRYLLAVLYEVCDRLCACHHPHYVALNSVWRAAPDTSCPFVLYLVRSCAWGQRRQPVGKTTLTFDSHEWHQHCGLVCIGVIGVSTQFSA